MDNEREDLLTIVKDLQRYGLTEHQSDLIKRKIETLIDHSFNNGSDWGKSGRDCKCNIRNSTIKRTPKQDICNGEFHEEEQWQVYRANEINRGN